MKISVVTPNFNGDRFLDEALRSVAAQRAEGADIEHIVVDGGSTDRSLQIIDRHRGGIDAVICERDRGPADAINKGLARSSGDLLGWLNADDFYFPGTLKRVAAAMKSHPERALVFGHCPIVDEKGREIRRGITGFKELFYPLSSRFVIQSINYLSQPATFFRRSAWEKTGALRTDLVAAWDYEFFLRLWRLGGAVRVGPPPLAAFRWHEASISGTRFREQFREEWDAAAADAGRFSLQSVLHYGVRWGIVASYSLMSWSRSREQGRG